MLKKQHIWMKIKLNWNQNQTYSFTVATEIVGFSITLILQDVLTIDKLSPSFF